MGLAGRARAHLDLIVFIACLAAWCYVGWIENDRWERFKADHHCTRIVDRPMPAMQGPAWQCDDGIYFGD